MNAYSVVIKLIDKLKANGGLSEEQREKVDVLYMLDRIDNDGYLAIIDKQGYHVERLDDRTLTLVEDEKAEHPLGDYLNPIHWEEGMPVENGLFYYVDYDPAVIGTGKDRPADAFRDGIPTGWNNDWFDII